MFETITIVESGLLSTYVHSKLTGPTDSMRILTEVTLVTDMFPNTDSTQMDIEECNANKEEADLTEMIRLTDKMLICDCTCTDSTETQVITESNDDVTMNDMTEVIYACNKMDIC